MIRRLNILNSVLDSNLGIKPIMEIIKGYDLDNSLHDVLCHVLNIIDPFSSREWNFYHDDVMIEIYEHVRKFRFSSQMLYFNIIRLMIKWIIYKKSTCNDIQFKDSFQKITLIASLFRSDDPILARKGYPRFPEFKILDFVRDPSLKYLLELEIMENWTFLIPEFRLVKRSILLEKEINTSALKDKFPSIKNDPLFDAMIYFYDLDYLKISHKRLIERKGSKCKKEKREKEKNKSDHDLIPISNSLKNYIEMYLDHFHLSIQCSNFIKSANLLCSIIKGNHQIQFKTVNEFNDLIITLNSFELTPPITNYDITQYYRNDKSKRKYNHRFLIVDQNSSLSKEKREKQKTGERGKRSGGLILYFVTD